MTESELMRIKRDLQARAKKKHMGKARTGAYVYGTLRKIRGNRCWKGYAPVRGKKAYSKGSCRKIRMNAGRKKTWKLGEYAIGGVIEAKVSQDNNAVGIRNATWDGQTLATRLFRWPLDRNNLDIYLNELTTSYYASKIVEWVDNVAGTSRLRVNAKKISDVALLKAYNLLKRYRRLKELLNRYDVTELMPSVSAIRNDPSTLNILTKIVAYTDSPYHARKLGVENLQNEVDAYVDETEQFLEENARSDARGMPRISVSRG